MESPTIHVLNCGYCTDTSNSDWLVSTTTSLLVLGDEFFVIDPGLPSDWLRIESVARQRGFDFSRTTAVVLTHEHVDHCANVGRFPGSRIWSPGQIYFPDGRAAFSDPTYLHHCPIAHRKSEIELRVVAAHSDADLIIYVETADCGRVCICGDIFENSQDGYKWQQWSKYPTVQENERKRIASECGHIVPGHGYMFESSLAQI